MFRTKQTPTEKLMAQVVEARDQAAPKATAAAERLKEAFDEARVRAAPVASDLADRARPRIEAAESTLVDSVLPKVGAALGVASAAVAQGAHEAKDLMRDYEPQVQQARESAGDFARVSSDRLRDAYRVLSGEAVAKPVKRGRRKWLFVIGLGAATIAAVAAYRKQQANNDPWATPADSTMGSTTGTTGFDTGGSMKDKAAEKVGQAKEAVTEAAAKAKDKATDLAAKGQTAVADRKDSVTEGEMESASARADEALDELRPETGQVTAIDATLGSDAIDASAGTLPSESVKPKRPKA